MEDPNLLKNFDKRVYRSNKNYKNLKPEIQKLIDRLLDPNDKTRPHASEALKDRWLNTENHSKTGNFLSS
jgi:hypothetical protein